MRVTPGLRPPFIKTHKTITALNIFNPCEGGALRGGLSGKGACAERGGEVAKKSPSQWRGLADGRD